MARVLVGERLDARGRGFGMRWMQVSLCIHVLIVLCLLRRWCFLVFLGLHGCVALIALGQA